MAVGEDWYAKEIRLIHWGCEKGRNYHRTFASKLSQVCSLFLRRGGTIVYSTFSIGTPRLTSHLHVAVTTLDVYTTLRNTSLKILCRFVHWQIHWLEQICCVRWQETNMNVVSLQMISDPPCDLAFEIVEDDQGWGLSRTFASNDSAYWTSYTVTSVSVECMEWHTL